MFSIPHKLVTCCLIKYYFWSNTLFDYVGQPHDHNVRAPQTDLATEADYEDISNDFMNNAFRSYVDLLTVRIMCIAFGNHIKYCIN